MTTRQLAGAPQKYASIGAGSTWTREQEELLRTLREAARVNEVAFAKRHTIALSQLRALEGQGDTPFYSETIKARLGTRLLASLGHVPAPASQPLAPAPPAHVATPAAARPPAPDRAGVPSTPAPPCAASQPLPGMGNESRPPLKKPMSRWAMGTGAACLLLLVVAVPALRTGGRPGASAGMQQIAPAASSFAATTLQSSASVGVAQQATSAPSPPQTASTGAGCHTTPRSQAPGFTPDQATRPGTYVHVEASGTARLCVTDAREKATKVTLRAGEARSISDPTAFQGQRVPPGAFGPSGVVLEAR